MINHNKTRYLKLWPAAIALGLLPIAATAETSKTTLFPETVVSASRVPVDRQKVGSAVSVLSQQDLEQSGTTFLSNNLRDLPSMSVSRSGTFGSFTEIRLRGSESNHVLIVIDGVRSNDPALGNQFDFARMLSYGLSRVEVLRGPQSGIFGPDALAGVISIETPEGTPGLRTQIFSEYGSFNTRIGGGRISGGIKGLTFSVFGARFETSGTNTSRPTALGFVNEDDDSDNSTIHGKIAAIPFPWLKLTFAGRYLKSRNQFDADNLPLGPFAGFTFDDGDGLSNDANRETRFESSSWITKAALNFFNKRWRIILSVSGLNTDTETQNNGTFNNSFAGTRIRYSGQTSFTFSTPGIARAEHKLIFAVEHEKQTFRQNVINTPAATQDQARKQTGFVGEYRLSLWNVLFLSGALRYDINDDFKNSFTFRGTAAYLLRRYRTRFHASIGRGVKNPTFLEQFGFFPNTFVGNPNLTPESSISFDLGVEQKLWGDRILVDLTYFDAQLHNEINGFASLGGGLFTAQNVAGLSRRRGFEFILAAKPFPRTTIKGQYSYLISQQAGTEEIRRARHSGAVSASYLFPGDRANVNVAFRFNGPQKDTLFGSFGNGFVNRRVTVGGYVLMSISGAYKINRFIEIFGRVENALNQRYEEVVSFQSPRIGVFAGIKIKLDMLR